MNKFSFERAEEEAAQMQEKIRAGEAKGYNEAEQRVRLDSHIQALRDFGLRGLEGRIQRGLDPAGMLAVPETRKIIQAVLDEAHTNLQDVEALTRALHVGAVWEKADDLARAEQPEVKAWMLLAHECHEINDRDLSPEEYLKDVDRIMRDLEAAKNNPAAALDEATKKIIASAKEKFVKKDGVAFSEEDAFLSMAIAGEKYGVCKAGELYFVGAQALDYSSLAQEGLVSQDREDRGRMATFYRREETDVVKVLYPGLAIVFGDEKLALRLAKSAQKFTKT